MNRSLFEGRRIRLVAPDPERDAETLSRWTHDPDYLQLVDAEPVRPSTPEQMKEKIESARKKMGGNQFEFVIRTRADDRPIGSVRLFAILWPHGVARLQLVIGDPVDRRQGYASEALELILRFAFDELNLHRVAAATPEHNQAALRLIKAGGFVQEVRQREAIHRDGGRCDLFHLALLRPEWDAMRARGTST
jgi:RimJ/RimL family protein N-acetyltransferase